MRVQAGAEDRLQPRRSYHRGLAAGQRPGSSLASGGTGRKKWETSRVPSRMVTTTSRSHSISHRIRPCSSARTGPPAITSAVRSLKPGQRAFRMLIDEILWKLMSVIQLFLDLTACKTDQILLLHPISADQFDYSCNPSTRRHGFLVAGEQSPPAWLHSFNIGS
jgi:hypothetical protein